MEPPATSLPVPSPAAASPSLDAAGRLTVDLHCRVCGYNLRGLAFDGACPECGAPVAASVSDLLRHCDPAWVGRLARGMTLLAWALAAPFLLMGVSFAAMLLIAAFRELVGESTAADGLEAALGVMWMVGGLGALVAALAGVWLVTAPEASQREREPWWSARGLARVGLIAAAAAYVGSSAAYWPAPMFATLLGLASPLLLLVGFLALCRRLRQLAFRLPDRGLATQTRIVFWGLLGVQVAAVALVVVVVIAIGVAWAQSGTGAGGGVVDSLIGAAMVLFFAGGCLLPLAAVALVVWLLVLATIYRRRFDDAAALARRHLHAMST